MKLSIITINLNNASGLQKTCLSVVTQTFKEFEWIIIDGASVDNSVDIIKQYLNNVSYWISEPDSGVYNAMNKGINIATGEYFLFLNSGDYLLHPWTLHEVINEIKLSKYADVYYTDVLLSDYQLIKHPKTITLNFFLKTSINHQNCIIRQKLFKDELYNENYKIASDWYFFIKGFYNNTITYFHIKTNITIYDINGISNNKKLISERKEILEKMNLVIKDSSFSSRKYLSSFCNILKLIKYILPYGLYKIIVFLKIKYVNIK